MISTAPHEYSDWISAQTCLAEQIASCQFPAAEGVLRCEVAAPDMALIDWLARQRNCPRYYWRDRHGHFEMAGVGEADVVVPLGETNRYQVVDRIRSRMIVPESALRYYGGFRFHAHGCREGRWHDFKGFRFIAPLFELCRNGDKMTLACNVRGGMERAQVIEHLWRLIPSCNHEPTRLPGFRNRSDLPDYEGWHSIVEDALADMRGDVLQKLVLARQSTFHTDQDIEPIVLLSRLAEKARHVYLFCFQTTGRRAFLGASPERLYRRDRTAIASEALAGTRPRGKTPEQDRELEDALRVCDKEQREHAIVVDDIRDILQQYCTHVETAPAPAIIKLAHCQHLHTPIFGELRSNVNDAQLLAALHPTPAVGGRPRRDALHWIFEREPFERGIYAAPVGWVAPDAAEFCVGIRSGLVRGTTLTLYAGAGIVPGSDAASEWHELDAKMDAFLQVIMGDA